MKLKCVVSAVVAAVGLTVSASGQTTLYRVKSVSELQIMNMEELVSEMWTVCGAAVVNNNMAQDETTRKLGPHVKVRYMLLAQADRDYLTSVRRVFRAKLGKEPKWLEDFGLAAFGQSLEKCADVWQIAHAAVSPKKGTSKKK